MRLHFSPSDVLGLSIVIGIVGGVSAAYILWQFPLFPYLKNTLLLSKPTPCDSVLKRFIHSLPRQPANDADRCSNTAPVASGGSSINREPDRAIAPNSNPIQNLDARSYQLTRCEQDQNKYWSGDLLTINFMNSPEGQGYRDWCHQVGVSLPTVSHVYDIVRNQPNLCLIVAQKSGLLNVAPGASPP